MEKHEILKMALAMNGYNLPERLCDLIVETMGVVNKKGGKMDIHDAVKLRVANEKKYNLPEAEIEVKAVDTSEKDG